LRSLSIEILPNRWLHATMTASRFFCAVRALAGAAARPGADRVKGRRPELYGPVVG
jgi:hypothetical protein